jgi:predicted metal-dependent hydrolase
MAVKIIHIPTIGDITLQKRRGRRIVRIKVDVKGKIIVTMPPYVPYMFGEQFVHKHRDWLIEELASRIQYLEDGQRVGKIHILRFEYEPGYSKPIVRVTATKIIVRHSSLLIHDKKVQTAAHTGAIRALKREGEAYLLKRLADIASAHDYSYESSSVRVLKGRWGSCTSKKHITLNCFLMQLPDKYIDYVIFHELAHTRVLDHSPEFWREFETHMPNAKQLRREMKGFQPTIPAQRVS